MIIFFIKIPNHTRIRCSGVRLRRLVQSECKNLSGPHSSWPQRRVAVLHERRKVRKKERSKSDFTYVEAQFSKCDVIVVPFL